MADAKFATSLLSLEGKVALVTGAASGIGAAVARYLSLAGATVVVADLDGTLAEQVAQGLRAAGGTSLAVRCDICREDEISELFRTTDKAFGRLDILVNNAGIFPHRKIEDIDTEFWNRVFFVNVRGTFLCTREAIKLMKSSDRGGRVIHISSTESMRIAGLGESVYSASKGSINALTCSLSPELVSHRITVNAVAPGAVDTEGARQSASSAGPDVWKAAAAQLPMGRMARPEDIAGAVLFLAAPTGAYITGQMLVVDGGLLTTPTLG